MRCTEPGHRAPVVIHASRGPRRCWVVRLETVLLAGRLTNCDQDADLADDLTASHRDRRCLSRCTGAIRRLVFDDVTRPFNATNCSRSY